VLRVQILGGTVEERRVCQYVVLAAVLGHGTRTGQQRRYIHAGDRGRQQSDHGQYRIAPADRWMHHNLETKLGGNVRQVTIAVFGDDLHMFAQLRSEFGLQPRQQAQELGQRLGGVAGLGDHQQRGAVPVNALQFGQCRGIDVVEEPHRVCCIAQVCAPTSRRRATSRRCRTPWCAQTAA